MTYTLVTGACGGLGRAFVRILAERGKNLLLTGRSVERLAALAEETSAEFSDICVKYCACDLTEQTSRQAFFRYMDGEGIIISRLVYVAGADIQKAFEKYTEEKLVFQSRVNFEGAVSFTRAVLSRSSLDGKTELLAIGSVSGIYPMPYFALYSATKAALRQFYAALRTELKGRAKVTCVQLGAIPTREDIIENIKSQGVWGRMAAKSPRFVAEASLRAVKRNKRTLVVGFWNKVMRAGTAMLPLSWKMKFIARRWKRTEKDAFS